MSKIGDFSKTMTILTTLNAELYLAISIFDHRPHHIGYEKKKYSLLTKSNHPQSI